MVMMGSCWLHVPKDSMANNHDAGSHAGIIMQVPSPTIRMVCRAVPCRDLMIRVGCYIEKWRYSQISIMPSAP